MAVKDKISKLERFLTIVGLQDLYCADISWEKTLGLLKKWDKKPGAVTPTIVSPTYLTWLEQSCTIDTNVVNFNFNENLCYWFDLTILVAEQNLTITQENIKKILITRMALEAKTLIYFPYNTEKHAPNHIATHVKNHVSEILKKYLVFINLSQATLFEIYELVLVGLSPNLPQFELVKFNNEMPGYVLFYVIAYFVQGVKYFSQPMWGKALDASRQISVFINDILSNNGTHNINNNLSIIVRLVAYIIFYFNEYRYNTTIVKQQHDILLEVASLITKLIDTGFILNEEI